ncbi:NAD-dependent epimerase/dehydratase family protein [Bacillus sp. V3-13]|uniref:NAD-dependent epimerase/dehydratase family protein n=1 Tax=Bacillus sp. V3-13 TaxID=2053728 RepID=UPI0015E13BDA|nr:NAD-dependent epimerase/dehydratase family protein [Bacillus sp. V3-13]
MSNGELHVIIGTGPLGSAIMDELISKGKQVRMVNRSGKANVANGVQVVQGDATNTESIRQACKGAKVIYHCAKPPYSEWPEKFPPIMDGLIEAAAHTDAKLVYADNLYMYGPTDHALTESLDYKATDSKGITRGEMANKLLAAHKSGKVQATIGRAPDFYGPQVLESAIGVQVCKNALLGKPALLLGNIDVPHTFTYIRDFAKGLVTLGEREEALGEVWHIPSAETLTTRQLVTLIFAEAKHEPKFRVASKGLLSLIGVFNKNMRELKGTFYQFEKPFVVDHSKYKKAFGEDITPHRVAIKETLEWYRKTFQIR